MKSLHAIGFSQLDRWQYQAITEEGSKHYEGLYMGGKLPTEDFNIFATIVYALSDWKKKFQIRRKRKKAVRHIDIGTGPNLYVFIASSPYVEEMVAVDIAPANIKRLKELVQKKTSLESHWYAWLELAVILYDIGSAEAFITLDKKAPHLYDNMLQWPLLKQQQKEKAREKIYAVLGISPRQDNPYRNINLQKELQKKLIPREGDLLDDIATVSDLIGTADLYTRVFVAESIDDRLEVVIHGETNGIQFARKGALSISGHITKADSYNGFFLPEELKKKKKAMRQFSGTQKFFETVVSKIVNLTNTYSILWERFAYESEERKMADSSHDYESAIILCGEVAFKSGPGKVKYQTGLELIKDIADEIRSINTKSINKQGNEHKRVMHCITDEVHEVVKELTSPHHNKTIIDISIISPARE